jgi:hypothetical protein
MKLPACRNLLKRSFCLFWGILFLVSICALAGNEFWEKKDYKQWAQKEVQKILEDSPWAKQLKLEKVAVMESNASVNAQGGEMQRKITYQVQFRTAKPIRQAMVRQTQLAQKYDSLSTEQKQEFDKKTEAFLSGGGDAVVVMVTYTATSQTHDLELARHWQSRTLDLLKNSVYLIPPKGDRVPLAQFAVAPGAERAFQFVFPRQVNGKPIISPEDKSVKLEFPYPVIDGMGDGRAFLEFKVDKMTINGEVAY